MEPPTTPALEPTEYQPRAIGQRAAAFLARLGSGDLADLRRHRRGEPPAPAYWRLWATLLEPHLPPAGERRDEFERQWATVFSVLARVFGLPGPPLRLGQALAVADFSELRFNRLLRARGEPLDDALRTAAAFLASKAVACDPGDLAELILLQDGESAERTRRSLARAYFKHQKNPTPEKES